MSLSKLILYSALLFCTSSNYQKESQRSFFTNYLNTSGSDSHWYQYYPVLGEDEMTSRRLDSIQKRVSRVYDGDYGRLVRFLPFFLQDLVIFILDNPFVGVVGIGSILTFIKKYFRKIYSYFTYEYMTTLDISEDHQTYRWIECWFNTRDWGKCYHVQGIFYLLLYHHTGLM